MYINNQGIVNHSTNNLFNGGSLVLSSPYKILGNGRYNGLDTTSRFISWSATQLIGFTLEIQFSHINSVCTSTVFNISLGNNVHYTKVNGHFVNARFGTVGTFSGYSGKVSFDSYGLLGGITIGTTHTSSTSTAWSLRGNHETPLAVTCVSANQMVESVGNIYGSTSWAYSSHSGKLRGTTHTISGGSKLDITSRSSVGVITGTGYIYTSAGSTVNITCTSGNTLYLYGAGYQITSYTSIDGTINNFGVLGGSTNNSGTGTINNYGKWDYAYFNTSFSGTIHNYGEIYLNAWTSGNAITLNNYGKMYVKQYSITLGNNATLINRGIIQTYGALSNTSAVVVLNHVNAVFDNFGIIENKETDITRSVIDKTIGKLLLRQGSYIKQSNSLSPIRCTANTSDSKDVYYFGVTSNCDGTTYGLIFAFDGGTFAPNDLVGGTLYENVNY